MIFVDKKGWKELIKAVARAYNELKEALDEALPDPRKEYLRYLYDLSQEPLSLDKMVRELKSQGYSDIVEKLLNKPPRKILGFLYWYGVEGEAVYKAYEAIKNHPHRPEIRVEDFSTDALTVADMIRDFNPERVIVFTLKSRGREPGIHRYTRRIERPSGIEAVEMMRPSLEGLLDVDALLSALGVFSDIDEVEVVECEPPPDNVDKCTELLISEALGEISDEEESTGGSG